MTTAQLPETVEPAATLDLPGRVAVRSGPASFFVRRRTMALVLACLAAIAVVGVISIGQGKYQLDSRQVIDALLGRGTRAQHVVVMNLRLPRVIAGVLVGIALGLSGALTQAVARNPLASPELLGVTDGAAAGAVTLIVLGRPGGPLAGLANQVGIPIAALFGATVAATAVYLLAWRRGIDGFRLILVGLMVGEMLSAVVNWMLERAEITSATLAVIWLNGSLSNRGWDDVLPLAVALAVLVPLAIGVAFPLGGLQFGDDTAQALGLRLQWAQFTVIFIAIAVAAAAVVTAGPISFVALAVPQIAARVCGGGRPPLMASALLGGVLVVGCDLIGRVLIDGRELPVGLVTSVVGAPYLLWLLYRFNRKASV